MSKATEVPEKGAKAPAASKKKAAKKVAKKTTKKTASAKSESKEPKASAPKTKSSAKSASKPDGVSESNASGKSDSTKSEPRRSESKSSEKSSSDRSSDSTSGSSSGSSSGTSSASSSSSRSDGDQRNGHSESSGQSGSNDQQDSGSRNRRKRKKRRGSSGGSGGGHHNNNNSNNGPKQGHGGRSRSTFNYGVLPSDEELEREAEELERIVAASDGTMIDEGITLNDLQRMKIDEVFVVAEKEGLEDFHQIPKQDLIFKILKIRAARQGIMFGEGTLQIMSDGFGFLRSPELSYLPGPDDIYVSPSQIRRFGLRRGMTVRGAIRPPKESERYFALLKVETVNDRDPGDIHDLVNFEDMVPMHPEHRFLMETEPDIIETRIVDLVAPIGKGQRALIVAPPRTGKTVLLQKMTKSISINFPESKIFVLLVDERPEEVTDFKRNVTEGVEVVASTFDEQSSRHVAVAEMVIEKAKRLVEYGEDVVIFLDSITRLARAYNSEIPHSGKIMTGGLDSNALQRPKKFFGAARAIERGGSLTIIGTALVDTGSKMDEVIFEEFKGTGNSELHLDRRLVEKRIYPAIDVAASGTRREELLMDPKELELVYRLRKVLADMNVVEAMELLKSRLGKHKTNAEFLMAMALS
ncbi:MAG: transcription termination factor Rho [Phycisphaerales bacterium]